jgi:hypothetical protein
MPEQDWKKLASAFNLMCKGLILSITYVLLPIAIPILAIACGIIFFKMLGTVTEGGGKEAFRFGALLFIHMIITALYMIEFLGVLSGFIGLKLDMTVSITSIDYTVIELSYIGLLAATYGMLKKFFARRTEGPGRSHGISGAGFVQKTAIFFLLAIIFRYLAYASWDYLLFYYGTIAIALYLMKGSMRQVSKAFSYLANPQDQPAIVKPEASTPSIPYFVVEPAGIPSQTFCGQCGAAIPPESGTKFCSACGAKLEP